MDPDSLINAVLGPLAQQIAAVVFYDVPAFGTRVPLIVVWLSLGGIVTTLALRFVNLRGVGHALRVIGGRYSSPDQPGETTPFQALATAVSGTVGLGNIAGVAVAIAIGGPGAAFWMVVAGFFAMSAKFAEVSLGVKYRRMRPDGTVAAGAMYYVPIALARIGLPRVGKALAVFFCVAAVGASLTVFQVNQAYSQFREVTGFQSGLLFGLAVAIWVALVLFGGMRRIARWTSRLVPAMCVLYLLACIVVLTANADNLLAALGRIVSEAFAPVAVQGGVIGALLQGFRRAAFSSEAGIGSAPMAHATVRTREPMSQGFAALVEPFLDTVIVCTMTALVIVVSGVATDGDAQGVALTSRAFATVVPWFPIVLAVSVILFALSTILGWGYYGEQSWRYLFGDSSRSRYSYRLLLCLMLSVAGTFPLEQVVNLADSMNFCMAIPNLLAVYILLPELRRDLHSYRQRIIRARQ
ncbi:MAG: alanine/glycine:cation symporter family protein [Steroidobacteraceae bacterium]|nr:alanine/glycine:cation symporter family protein [Steroidobacteraceae bacterium]